MTHPLLKRQLRRLGLDEGAAPSREAWAELLAGVGRTYVESDRDRYTLERSLSISSREMQDLHQSLREVLAAQSRTLEGVSQARDELEVRVVDRTSELQREATARQEAQDRLLLVLESVLDYAIFALDLEGRVVEWNAAAERITGCSEKEIVGQHVRRFYADADRDAADGQAEADVALVRAQGRVESEGWRVRSDGLRFWAHSIMTPIKNSRGDLLGFAVVMRDTTKRRRLEQQLRHAERLNTVGKLAAGVAHELGTPLNVLMGRAEMISTRSLTEDQTVRSSEIILAQGEKMATLIRHLLQFGRQSGTDRVRLDLRLVARQTAMLLTPIAHKAQVEILVDEVNDPLAVSVNARELEQVVSNLVMNAIQATPPGGCVRIETGRSQGSQAGGLPASERSAPAAEGSEPRIEVAGQAARLAHLVVQDMGSGIAAEHLAQVFDPFFTTKEVGQGTGLGLSIAHGIIQDHGGRIEVQSRKNTGSTFSVFLPECDR